MQRFKLSYQALPFLSVRGQFVASSTAIFGRAVTISRRAICGLVMNATSSGTALLAPHSRSSDEACGK